MVAIFTIFTIFTVLGTMYPSQVTEATEGTTTMAGVLAGEVDSEAEDTEAAADTEAGGGHNTTWLGETNDDAALLPTTTNVTGKKIVQQSAWLSQDHSCLWTALVVSFA